MASLRLFVLVLVLAIPALAQEKTVLSFHEFLSGNWSVQRSVVSLKSFEQTNDVTIGRYSFHKVEGSQTLVGSFYENDTTTGELSNDLVVAVEFTNPLAGVFKTGASEDELKPLFNFDFKRQSNDVVVSHGEWLGAQGGFYQFMAFNDRFTITVYPSDPANSSQVIVWAASKIPEVVERSFFSKYGSTIMLVGFMIFNMWMKNKQQMQQQQQMHQQPRQRPVAPAGAPASGGATIEEIDEHDANKTESDKDK
eukprot:TRINITY_DN283_c0_g1_i1.p1 TRINITY_DN283_c0_g1~~TRINITY_DN283_c0_g1_i1.p1  ORF type:complete len:252 (+),score=79.69 TRINITY_DN283_c0_g1_i1:58-813(+)